MIPGVPITPAMLLAELVGSQDDIDGIAVVGKRKDGTLFRCRTSMTSGELSLAAAVMQADAVASVVDHA